MRLERKPAHHRTNNMEFNCLKFQKLHIFSILILNHDECVHAFCMHVKRHAPLWVGWRRQWKTRGSWEEREDGRSTGGRAAGWKREPEVVSPPAFKRSPLGLTEPRTYSSVLLPTLSPGPPVERAFGFLFWDLRCWKRVEEAAMTKEERKFPNHGRQLWLLQKTGKHMFIWLCTLLASAWCK